MSKIYKDGIAEEKGKFYGKIKIKGVQRQFLCHGAKNRTEAQAIVDSERFKLRQELGGIAKNDKKKTYTIQYLRKRCLENSEKKHKATVDKDITHFEFFVDYFTKKHLTDISLIKQKHIKELQQVLKNTPTKRGAQRENSTVNRYIATLRNAFNILIKDEDVDIYFNPCKGVEDLIEDNRRTTYLPENLHEEFYSYLPEYARDLVKLDLNTGLRTGNVFNAHKSEFDIELGYWTIERKKNKGKKFIRIKLNKIALEIVKKYYYNTDDYLIKNPDTGKPYTSIKKCFRTAAKKIGIPNLQPRDLRRTVGTILYQKGKSLRVIKDVLHHTDASTTERYLGITAEELDQAYEALAV